jgi:hypothetical protein
MRMDREYIRQNGVIERYLSGHLREEELTAFEERCLWCADTLEELAVAERLREGLREGGSAPLAGDGRAWVTRWLLSPQWAAAATVLLAVSLSTTGWLLARTGPAGSGMATAHVYSIELLRGSEAPAAVIRVGPSDEWVVLLVYPELGEHERFRAILHRTGEAEPAWQSADIPPGAAESLALTLPAKLLGPGDYRLRVAGLNSGAPGDPVGEVVFRVVVGE